MQKHVNLVDLVKTQELSNEYLIFTSKIWRRYSRERASQSSPKISQRLEKVRKILGKRSRAKGCRWWNAGNKSSRLARLGSTESRQLVDGPRASAGFGLRGVTKDTNE